MIAYLSGPIENAENDGVGWRRMMTEWLSFNLNPQFSYTRFGNISSLSSSLNWKLNPKFEIIPEANINLHNAENNFSLTGRTYLSKNIIMKLMKWQ